LQVILILTNLPVSGSANNNLSEEYYLLGFNTLYSVESPPTFRRNISPPSSGLNKQSKIQAGILLDLFDPEDGGGMFLLNLVDFLRIICRYSPKDNILHNHFCEKLKSMSMSP
jgi:hypothetical protein